MSRAGPMRPSRRVILLTVVAVACGVLVVGVGLTGLASSQDSVRELEERVLPAHEALESTQAEAAESQRLFLRALESGADARAVLVADSQVAGTRASAHWHRYKRLAFGSSDELTLQRRYEAELFDAQAAGAVVFGLVDSPDEAGYRTALAGEQELSQQSLATLETIVAEYYAPRTAKLLAETDGAVGDTRFWMLIAFGAVLLVGIAIALVMLRGSLAEEHLNALREIDRRRDERRANLETQLQRGLEMEPTEESTYEVIGAALSEVRPSEPVELLVADSSRAHFRQVVSTDARGRGPGCPVTSPEECPAANSGQTRLFLSSVRLDACPFLRTREGSPRSAACVPVSVAGETTAVIHTTGPDHECPAVDEVSELELVARKAGDRIGFLRVLARTETQARIDVLTGLFNRRSLEQQAQDVVERGDPFVVAFADLDHFKKLNDEFGHEMGDRALRLFGRVLRDSVRPADIPARYGGEEFVVVLPDCLLSDARMVAERVRERLTIAVAAAAVPAFTISIGLAASEPPEGFGETVARADTALLHAKQTGGDRIVATVDIPAQDGGDDEGAEIPVSAHGV